MFCPKNVLHVTLLQYCSNIVLIYRNTISTSSTFPNILKWIAEIKKNQFCFL